MAPPPNRPARRRVTPPRTTPADPHGPAFSFENLTDEDFARYRPSPERLAACRANPVAMAALDFGDHAAFARAMGIEPSEAYLEAANRVAVPLRPPPGQTPSGQTPSGQTQAAEAAQPSDTLAKAAGAGGGSGGD